MYEDRISPGNIMSNDRIRLALDVVVAVDELVAIIKGKEEVEYPFH
jgi:hypothetical protein